MLWNTTLRPLKKAGLIVLFSGGFFIMACGLARAVLIVAVGYTLHVSLSVEIPC